MRRSLTRSAMTRVVNRRMCLAADSTNNVERPHQACLPAACRLLPTFVVSGDRRHINSCGSGVNCRLSGDEITSRVRRLGFGCPGGCFRSWIRTGAEIGSGSFDSLPVFFQPFNRRTQNSLHRNSGHAAKIYGALSQKARVTFDRMFDDFGLTAERPRGYLAGGTKNGQLRHI